MRRICIALFTIASLYGVVGCGQAPKKVEEAPKLADYGSEFIENANRGLRMKMIFVQGGTFQMGATSEQGSDAYDNERPVHAVTLDSYYIAESEVTQAQWQAVMGSTVHEKCDLAGGGNTLHGVGYDYPMYYVTWREAQDFCVRLSEMTGKNYVLPTEAQWEYAARGGRQGQRCKYSGSNDVNAVAWYKPNSNKDTHPVMQKMPNELGLYDMSGNVYEWCNDLYSGYTYEPQIDPKGGMSGGKYIVRGGCVTSSDQGCRVSNRYRNSPAERGYGCGFRVACLLTE